jgi:hypothetical protein
MTTRNDVTGDKIQTKVKEESYYDSPFWAWLEAAKRRDLEWEEKQELAHLRWTRAIYPRKK